MSANMGTIDRALRLILGVVLVVLPFVTSFALWETPALRYGAMVVGAVFIVTSLVRFCPLYTLIGLKTCRDC